MVAVVDEVDARVGVPVTHLRISRHVGTPFLWVVANEVVALPGELFQPSYFGRGVAADELHAQNGAAPTLPRFGTRNGQAEACPYSPQGRCLLRPVGWGNPRRYRCCPLIADR